MNMELEQYELSTATKNPSTTFPSWLPFFLLINIFHKTLDHISNSGFLTLPLLSIKISQIYIFVIIKYHMQHEVCPYTHNIYFMTQEGLIIMPENPQLISLSVSAPFYFYTNSGNNEQ